MVTYSSISFSFDISEKPFPFVGAAVKTFASFAFGVIEMPDLITGLDYGCGEKVGFVPGAESC
jgi:hypothetical protein